MNCKIVGLKMMVFSLNIKCFIDLFGFWKIWLVIIVFRNFVFYCNLFVNIDMVLMRLSRLFDKCDDFLIVEFILKRFSLNLLFIIFFYFKL